jgi:hypothetical protein
MVADSIYQDHMPVHGEAQPHTIKLQVWVSINQKDPEYMFEYAVSREYTVYGDVHLLLMHMICFSTTRPKCFHSREHAA